MPGTVLLLAASPAGKGRLVDAASVLPVLAAVAPAVLSGTETANVVELADPLEPQAVLTRLRAAAAAPGPLTVFLTGQLQLDRRQHQPHVALARSTPATVRYTGFPWQWITEELRLRPPGATSLVVDLHADPEAWQHLAARPLTAGPGVSLYGRLAPPPPRRAVAAPTYMKAVATLLRSGHRPPLPQLHQQALARLAEETGAYGDVVLTWDAEAGRGSGPASASASAPGSGSGPAAGVPVPRPAPVAEIAPASVPVPVAGPPVPSPVPEAPDPHAAITAAVQEERHEEAEALAARYEEEALGVHGPASEEALHWAEVRADLAMFAGDPVRSCRTWLAVASTRLWARQAPDAPAVENAVDRAHHQWARIEDAERSRELGAQLAELRTRVPGRRAGALAHVREQLERLADTGTAVGTAAEKDTASDEPSVQHAR
ncbi:hypothetical protein QFZ63_003977 [Streptomyces sp. B3I7]|uniref:hypothetical protein n=1 Tax=Streptomyces sp. B3I7 TaxID=3042269 RepID=UPI00277E39E4|nr:hypothetical protein [Streptomyces sp. B3I7]MDQ0812263.1 hypothetical protein [Streptomyces sp. B3I7]